MGSPEGPPAAAPDHRGGPTGEYSHENEHIADPQSGILRASVVGLSDGLVSNLALIMGVAGGSGDPEIIVLAGIAGLLAGAFSMAAGEYISMQTQREMLERELAIEKDHIERFPDEEEAHLAELLQSNGVEAPDAERIAAQIHREGGPALEFHAQLELGIHPGSLGAPTTAAAASLLAFAAGAAVPVVPWLLTPNALPATIISSAIALLAAGALATRFTHRGPGFGALRQLLVGAAAAAVTYGVGMLIAGRPV